MKQETGGRKMNNIFNIKLVSPEFEPTKAHSSDAGFDLKCREIVKGRYLERKVDGIVCCVLKPGDRCLVMSGVHIELKPGWEAQIRPRSGLALKYGITIVNSPGTIDSDYRGEIGVILHNTAREDFSFNVGDKIAQMVIKQVPQVSLCVVDELNNTVREAGGFGSSDNKE